ncbi:uncharacterized protein LOC134536914 [Bacillus rossius redtenbacheri]|uniref:uncharacterized protein LOC134536914 n=1 Tax=Bacillus rossius redtenbacheri TaxID=93214 RepID=UPI002FDECE6B
MRTLRTCAILLLVGVLAALLAAEAEGRRGGGGGSRISWGSRSISTSRSSIRRREHNYEGSSRRRGGSPQDYDTNPLPSKDSKTGGASGQKSSSEVHVPMETDRVTRKGGQSSIESGPAKETTVKNSRKSKGSSSGTV